MSNVSGVPPRNHVFVDFENVHHVDPALLDAKQVSVTLLIGARQSSLDTDLVMKLLACAADVHLVRMTSSGKNAVDFALAYYLGRAVLAEPGAYFHVISKDTGFDPLIEHLLSRHVRIRRHDDSTALVSALSARNPTTTVQAAVLASPTAKSADILTVVVDRLRKHTNNRPKKKKTLLSHLKSGLGKDATDTDANALLDRLIKAKKVKIDGKDVVTYSV